MILYQSQKLLYATTNHVFFFLGTELNFQPLLHLDVVSWLSSSQRNMEEREGVMCTIQDQAHQNLPPISPKNSPTKYSPCIFPFQLEANEQGRLENHTQRWENKSLKD